VVNLGTVLYGKINGQSIPLTVCIDWQPDGTIKPRTVWTPDGAAHRITRIYDCVPLAYLNNGGEGLRFKVQTEEIPELYIYFADGRFCEKNIVDSRYGHAAKVFVAVTMDIFPDGDYELSCFHFNGKRYQIEKITSVEPRGSFYAGGIGLRHKTEVRQVNENGGIPDPANDSLYFISLYLELNKWFIPAGVWRQA
jgi:hypothetical protein